MNKFNKCALLALSVVTFAANASPEVAANSCLLNQTKDYVVQGVTAVKAGASNLWQEMPALSELTQNGKAALANGLKSLAELENQHPKIAASLAVGIIGALSAGSGLVAWRFANNVYDRIQSVTEEDDDDEYYAEVILGIEMAAIFAWLSGSLAYGLVNQVQ